MRLSALAGAIALAFLLPCAAIAQSTLPGTPIKAPAGFLPGTAIYCDDGTGKAILCNFASNGGGGSAGDPSSTGTPGAGAPATVSMLGVYDGSAVRRMLADTAGRAIVNINSLPALPAGTATIGTVNLGAGGLGTSGSPIYTAPTVSAIGVVGNTAPGNATEIGGVGPSGSLRAVATDTGGRLLPAQGAVASIRTALTASTATSISGAVAGRVGLSISTEAALTANVFICTTQATTCSATNYDFLLPSGAGAGTIYTSLFAPIGTVYAFSTGTPTLVVNNWSAQ